MDLKCYHCCEVIDKTPLSMPVEYNEIKDEYKFYGYFCSWECMKTFNLEDKSSNKNVIFNNIEDLYIKMNGTKEIMFAPFKHELKYFGGNLTIEEFKQKKTKHKQKKLTTNILLKR